MSLNTFWLRLQEEHFAVLLLKVVQVNHNLV